MKAKIVGIIMLFLLLVGQESQMAFAISATPSQPTPTLKVPANPPRAAINLSVSPPFLSLTTDPGQEITSEFRIRNNNNFDEYYHIKLQKFETAENGEGVALRELDSGDEFAKWMSVDPQEFELDANQTRTVKVTIKPPNSAALGYYYALVISRLSKSSVNQGAAISGSAAVPVLLTVRSENTQREVKIGDLKTDKLIYEYLPVTFGVTVENTGNIHTIVAGDLFIDSSFSKNVGSLPINQGRGSVLPNSRRTFSVIWDDGMIINAPLMVDGQTIQDSKGKTKYSTKFDFDKPLSKFRFGKYTAHALLIYDNGERDIPLEARVSFWVIPWRIILAAVGIIFAPVILFILIGKIKRRFKK